MKVSFNFKKIILSITLLTSIQAAVNAQDCTKTIPTLAEDPEQYVGVGKNQVLCLSNNDYGFISNAIGSTVRITGNVNLVSMVVAGKVVLTAGSKLSVAWIVIKETAQFVYEGDTNGTAVVAVGTSGYLVNNRLGTVQSKNILQCGEIFGPALFNLRGCTPVSLEQSNYRGAVENSSNVEESLVALNTFPNPANGSVNVTYQSALNGFVTFEVLDVLGKTVYSSTLAKEGASLQAEINTASFESGMYSLVVKSGDKVKSTTLIVQH